MNSAWTAAGNAFRFSAGGLEGMLEPSDDAKSLRIAFGDVRIGGLGDLQWKVEGTGDAGMTTPIPDVAYIQQPYVVAPFVVNSPVGLRLTAFFRATDAGIDADFRLATIETLDDVSLDVKAVWPQGSFRAAGVEIRTRFPGVSAGVLQLKDGPAALLIDVGERGQFTPTDDGASMRLFHQSLEKGVILVGRFALRPFKDDRQLQRDLDDWLDHPSASL